MEGKGRERKGMEGKEGNEREWKGGEENCVTSLKSICTQGLEKKVTDSLVHYSSQPQKTNSNI